MLKAYEVKYRMAKQNNTPPTSPITNSRWKETLEEKKLDPKEYVAVPLT